MNTQTPKFAGFRKTLIAASLALVGIAAVAATLPAVAGPHRGGPFAEQMAELNLSDAQRSEIRKIMMSQRDSMKGEREALRNQLIAFAELDPQAPQYADSVEGFADQAEARARELAPALLDLQAKLRAVLTPEQRAMVQTKVADADIEDRMKGRNPMFGMMESLQLSDQQWLDLRHIQQAQREASAEQRAAAQQKLASFIALDPAAPDYATRSAELTEAFVQNMRLRVLTASQLQGQVYAVLTPEQRVALVAELKDFKPRQHRGRHETHAS